MAVRLKPALLTGALCAVLTVLAVLAFDALSTARWQRQEASEAAQRLMAQEARLRRALQSLDALEALLAGNDQPEPAQFRQLEAVLRASSGVDNLFVAVPLAAAERSAFEQHWRKVYPNFALQFRLPGSVRLRLRSTEWRDYLPVVYGERSSAHRFGLGQDLSAEAALIPDGLAGKAGHRVLSPPFSLENGEVAVLGLSWQRTQQHGHLLGALLLPAALLAQQTSQGAWQDYAFDITDAGQTRALFSGSLPEAAPAAVRSFALGGRQWRLESYRLLPAPHAGEASLALALLGGSFSLLAMLLAGYRRGPQREPSLEQQRALQGELASWQARASHAARDRLRLQALLDTTAEAVLLIDDQGCIELFNPAAERLFGYPLAEIRGLSAAVLLPDSQRQQLAEQGELGQALARLADRQAQVHELVGLRRDGAVFPLEMLLNHFELDETSYFVAVIRDVSDRRRAERLLFESEQKHRGILDAAQIGIFLLQEGRLRYVNPAFAAYFGRKPADLLGSALIELVAPDWRQGLQTLLDPYQSGWRPSELLMQRPDGSRFQALLSSRPISLDQQPGQAGSLLDISERKAAEEARLRAEIRNMAILEAIPDLMLQLDPAGLVMDCRARAGGADFGLGHDCIGRHYKLALPPALALPLYEALQKPAGTGLRSFEYSLIVNEQRHQFEARLTAAAEGEWLLMVRDISARKAIEAELIRHRDHLAELVRERTAELDTLFAASPLPTLFLRQQRIQAVNQAFVTQFGYSLEQLLGRTPRVLMDSDEDYARMQDEAGKALHSGAVVRMELRFRAHDGWLVLCEAFGKAVQTGEADGGAIWVFQDIGARRTAEEAMLKARDLAEAASHAKSEFLANMSHELRTPMHAVLSFAELAERRAGGLGDEKLVHFLGRIRSSGQRLLQILNDLLDLSRLEAGKMRYDMQAVALGPLLREVQEECQPLARARQITVALDLPADLPPVYGDPLRLGQVLRNLADNALKFSPDAATVQMRARLRERVIELSVEDEGVGIPPDELGLIFDKFMQSSKTKTGAGGTGLGLAICSEIVTAHGGRIRAENRAEGGACIRLTLPLAP